MTNVTIKRELLADLLSLDREKRIPAERHLYAILENPAPEVEPVEVVAYIWGRSTEGICTLIDYAGNKAIPLMTVAQHNRIIQQLTSK